MTILQVLGFDKCHSNEIFTIKTIKRAASVKQTIVLKQSRGFPKEYTGIGRVFDTTEHSAQALKKVLTSEGNKTSKLAQNNGILD